VELEPTETTCLGPEEISEDVPATPPSRMVLGKAALVGPHKEPAS
jgi:hypothetical protein